MVKITEARTTWQPCLCDPGRGRYYNCPMLLMQESRLVLDSDQKHCCEREALFNQ